LSLVSTSKQVQVVMILQSSGRADGDFRPCSMGRRGAKSNLFSLLDRWTTSPYKPAPLRHLCGWPG
jgi:hypothetical protein